MNFNCMNFAVTTAVWYEIYMPIVIFRRPESNIRAALQQVYVWVLKSEILFFCCAGRYRSSLHDTVLL
jgi:hypothetical protein